MCAPLTSQVHVLPPQTLDLFSYISATENIQDSPHDVRLTDLFQPKPMDDKQKNRDDSKEVRTAIKSV